MIVKIKAKNYIDAQAAARSAYPDYRIVRSPQKPVPYWPVIMVKKTKAK